MAVVHERIAGDRREAVRIHGDAVAETASNVVMNEVADDLDVPRTVVVYVSARIAIVPRRIGFHPHGGVRPAPELVAIDDGRLERGVHDRDAAGHGILVLGG